MTDASTSQHAVLLTTAAGIALVACVFADVVPVLAAVTVAGIVAWGAARRVGVPASSIEAPALSIAACLVATAAWASTPWPATTPYLAWLVVAVALARAAGVPAARGWIVALLVTGAATVAAYTVVIRLTSVDPGRLIPYPAVRHWGFYPEIGVLCALVLPLTLGVGLRMPSRRGTAAAAVLALTIVVGLALSASRASWVAAAAACLVVAAPARRRGGVAAGVLLVVGVVLVGQTVAPPLLRGRSMGAAMSSRQVAWVRALSLWRLHPLVGWGPGQYRAAYRQVFGPDTLPASETAHNLPLQVGVEMGLAGVLTLSWLGLRVARSVRGRLAETGVVVALAVRLMTDVLDPASEGLRVFLLSAVLVGLAARASRHGSDADDAAGAAT